MSQISALTPEQIARFPEFVERWTKIGLSTEKVDKIKAELAAKAAYEVANITPPTKVAWFQGPLSLVLGDLVLKSNRVFDSLKEHVATDFPVRDSVGYSVRDSVWNSVGDSVRGSVGDSVGDSVRGSVRGSVGDSVKDSVRDSVWDSVRDSVNSLIYGQYDAYWLSYYSYFLDVCGLEACKKLLPLMNLAENCSFWIARRDMILLSEKHIYCNLDTEKRLHAEGRMAIEYSDGFGVYAYHGIKLPKKYGIKKYSDWESKWLLKENNAELRRVLIEQIGYEKIYQELEAKKIDSWREYELLKIENADIEPIVLVKMVCPSTKTIHVHRCPPDMVKAKEAITWCNHGISPESFIIEH